MSFQHLNEFLILEFAQIMTFHNLRKLCSYYIALESLFTIETGMILVMFIF